MCLTYAIVISEENSGIHRHFSSPFIIYILQDVRLHAFATPFIDTVVAQRISKTFPLETWNSPA